MNEPRQTNTAIQYLPPANAKIEWFAQEICARIGQPTHHPHNDSETAREFGNFLKITARIYAKHYQEIS